MAALIIALWAIHAVATEALPNTDISMLVFHGSAALFDMVLLAAAPYLLAGRLCSDTEALLLVSMLGNAAGWLFYMAYLPPIFYNAGMALLSLAQGLRLLYVDRHDADHLGLDLVCGRDRFRNQLYS